MTEETPKKRGRPKGSKDKDPVGKKIKLKHNPKSAREDFLKRYKGVTDVGIYGIDTFTLEIINHLWKNPEISFLVTDPNDSILTNANRTYSQRSFSMYRWETTRTSGFIETPKVEVVIVSSKYIEEVKKRPNPYNVELIVLEDL